MKIKLKVPKKLKYKVNFTVNLLFFGLIFYGVWWLAPNFYLLKLFTAKLVSYTSGSILLTSMDGIFLKRGEFVLQIITDCTAWKEIFVFLALFLSWPKKKDYAKAIKSLIAILLFNLIRLDILMFFPNSFDYFHPGFQYLAIGFILFLWTWSVGITKLKFQITYSKPRKKAKKRKKK
ncbi:MAG: hypothetical protein GOU98_02215 [Candidatus Altiarchaeota archaeon]|nr:hypothetical protein [Candidatus Altiarchaeota archaeon]